jgi:DNA-binding response OmpR family regulator
MQILLVEDDQPTYSILAESLAAHHYQVSTATDGQAGLELAQQFEYDLILLDVGLPRLDGISLCQKLRLQGYHNPILLLTARDSTSDRILGLDAGADDYVVKPFDLEELLARVRALLRRGKSVSSSVLTWENLRFDAANSEITAIQASGPQLLHLTPKEYGLLELFLLNPKRVFSRSNILDRLWNLAEAPGEETVSTHIKCLRQKLKAAGIADPIETVHGMGYRLRPPATEATSEQANAQPAKRQINRDKIRATTARIWQHSKARFVEQVQMVEQAIRALENRNLTPELQQHARQAAHKLAGSLGIFGLSTGSQLAKELEDWLQPQILLEQTQAVQLSEAVQRLYREIDSKDANLSAVTPNVPLVLVIDNDAQLTQQLQTQAPNWNIQIEVVADLATAGKIIRQTPPSLILLDLNPDIESALPELRQSASQIPLVALTTRDSLQDRLAASQLGGCLFLQKPLPIDEIRDAITRTLNQRQAASFNRVMVVDDEDAIIQRLAALLQPLEIEVIGVSDPQQFWQVLQTTIPSLLILDLQMPDFDGLQLCQVVRSDPHWSDLPIVFLSSHTQSEQIDQAFMAGADDYLNKSADPIELTERIVRRLKRAGFRKQDGKPL